MRPFVVAAALLAGVTLAPRTADAQFGGLIKRAAEKVTERRTGTVSSLITAESAPKLLAGLTAEARLADSIGRVALAQHTDVTSRVDAFLKRYASWSASQAAVRREQAAYAECSGAPSQELMAASQSQPASNMASAMAMQKKMDAMSPAERDAFDAKMDKLQEQAEAAEKSGNVAEQQRIRGEIAALTGMNMNPSASDQRASAASRQRMQTAAAKLQKCTPPKAPMTAPPEAITVPRVVTANGVASLSSTDSREIHDSLSAQEYIMSLRTMVLGDRTVEGGAAAAGMSKGEYALQRERVVYFFILPGIRGESANSGVLKDEEWDALQEHRSEFIAVGTKLRRLGAI